MGKFNTYGCGPRCLIEASRRKDKFIEQDEFIKQFGDSFPMWKVSDTEGRLYCGYIDTIDELIKPAVSLGFSIEGLTADYQVAKKSFSEGNLILVNAKKFSLPGSKAVTNHVVLIEDMNDQTFSVWCPYNSGTNEVVTPPYDKARWPEMDCSALILIKKA